MFKQFMIIKIEPRLGRNLTCCKSNLPTWFNLTQSSHMMLKVDSICHKLTKVGYKECVYTAERL